MMWVHMVWRPTSNCFTLLNYFYKCQKRCTVPWWPQFQTYGTGQVLVIQGVHMYVICDKTRPYIFILLLSCMFLYICRLLDGHQSKTQCLHLTNFNEFTIQARARQIQYYRSLNNVSYMCRYWHLAAGNCMFHVLGASTISNFVGFYCINCGHGS